MPFGFSLLTLTQSRGSPGRDVCARAVGAACCLLAAIATATLAFDDWRARSQQSGEVLAAARHSGNDQYWLRLAALWPGDDRRALEAALADNPRNSDAWIKLAIAQEAATAKQQASAAFAQAALVDRQFLPAWSRANFAFRSADLPLLWSEGARAVTLAFDDLRPLLDLAERAGAEPETILDRWGDEHTPGGARLRRAYLDVLIGGRRWDDALLVARRLLNHPGSGEERTEDQRRLFALVDFQIDAGRSEQAWEVWQGLTGLAALPLSNGDLGHAPSGHGFDWRTRPSPAIVFRWRPGAAEFNFSGQQEDESLLLEQPVVLNAAPRSYHFSSKIRTPGNDDSAQASSAFVWSLEWPQHRPLVLQSGVSTTIRTPPSGTRQIPAHLRLLYRRPVGAAPFVGRLSLGPVELTPADPDIEATGG